MLKFISRAGKSAMRGLFPRDVKLNTLDKAVGLQSCNLQQLQGTQPLLLFGFESQRSLASSNFASRATIFDAFQNHRTPHKNIEFVSFSQFLKTLPILNARPINSAGAASSDCACLLNVWPLLPLLMPANDFAVHTLGSERKINRIHKIAHA